MDLETENHLASLLMEEARRLRLEADKDGVNVYLCKPNVRGRPNSRFLTATVLGIQQANRVVEVREMWRARDKEKELDAKRYKRSKEKSLKKSRMHNCRPLEDSCTLPRSIHEKLSNSSTLSHFCAKEAHEDCSPSDVIGMRDEEIEEFLQSRRKRGRGSIGSRMDEPGPYLSRPPNNHDDLSSLDIRVTEEWERRIYGPEKPSFLKLPMKHEDDRMKHGSVGPRSPEREKHSRKHGSNGKSEKKGREKKKKKHGKQL